MAKSSENLARVTRVGLDLAKNVFQVRGVDAQGEVVIVRKLRRAAAPPFFDRLKPCCAVRASWRSKPFARNIFPHRRRPDRRVATVHQLIELALAVEH